MFHINIEILSLEVSKMVCQSLKYAILEIG